MKESTLMREIQLTLTKAGCRLFRNQIGSYRIGTRYIRYGLANPGGSDLIGWYKGKFMAVEVKTPVGKLTTEQQRFLDAVHFSGGIAFVARSVDMAVDEFRRQRERHLGGNVTGLPRSSPSAP